MTFCPGKKDPSAMTGAWDRDLATDLAAIKTWGADVLLTVMEDHELDQLGVSKLGQVSGEMGISWYQLPVTDASIPDARFEGPWPELANGLIQRIQRGQNIVVHCRGGLGRTGLVAGLLLVSLGVDASSALRNVRTVRPGAVETRQQEVYLMSAKTAP